MTAPKPRARWIAALAGVLLVLAAAAAGFVLKQQSDGPPARAPGDRPELLLLTSLPIAFPEGFTLEGSNSPALAALQSRYEVVPISTTDAGSLAGKRLLLMAQPNAQPAEMLVELDAWVRSGGHVLLLADPVLEWPSELALSDVSRPPTTFPDTGLLGHWGLRLQAPDQRGPKSITVADREVRTVSPGQLVATSPACAVASHGLVARCTVGRGRATIIADADFVGVEHIEGGSQAGNLALLLAELARLEP